MQFFDLRAMQHLPILYLSNSIGILAHRVIWVKKIILADNNFHFRPKLWATQYSSLCAEIVNSEVNIRHLLHTQLLPNLAEFAN